MSKILTNKQRAEDITNSPGFYVDVETDKATGLRSDLLLEKLIEEALDEAEARGRDKNGEYSLGLNEGIRRGLTAALEICKVNARLAVTEGQGFAINAVANTIKRRLRDIE